MKEVVIVLLNEFAEWECGYVAPLLNGGIEPGRDKYKVKYLSLTKEPVVSIGGLRVLPDYDLDDVPQDIAGLILIGGMKWFVPENEQLLPLIQRVLDEDKPLGAICNATVFLAKYGFLDQVKHTSNTLEYLKQYAGEKYQGDANYINEQAVRDANIITANGTATLEFTKEMLYALEADTAEKIEGGYQFYKLGFCEMIKQMKG